MLYPVKKRKDIYGHLLVNGFTYMGPFKVAPATLALHDRSDDAIKALTTLGALDSQILTLSTLSFPLENTANLRLYGPEDGPYIFRQGLEDIRLYVAGGELLGEFSTAKIASAPPVAASQIGNYGLVISAPSDWQPGDSLTYTAVEFMS